MKKDIISEKLGAQFSLSENIDDDKKMVLSQSEDISEKGKELMREKDKETVRDNIKDVIKQGMTLIPDMISLTRELQSPKMYESASIFMKTLVEMNKSLQDLDQEKPKPKKEEKNLGVDNPGAPQTNNFFIGTTEDLLDKLKKTRKDEVIDVGYEEIKDEKPTLKKPKKS